MSLLQKPIISAVPEDYIQYDVGEKVLVDLGFRYKKGQALSSIFLPGRIIERITHHGVHDMYVVDVYGLDLNCGQGIWLPNRFIRKYSPKC
jgi:hypothetical protein